MISITVGKCARCGLEESKEFGEVESGISWLRELNSFNWFFYREWGMVCEKCNKEYGVAMEESKKKMEGEFFIQAMKERGK
jgi:hypothetical protein